MEDNNHEQAHTQNTEIDNAYAATRAYVSRISQSVGGVVTGWSNTSGPIADWYYTVSANTNTNISPQVTNIGLSIGDTRIINPELNGLKDTVAALKKELEEMKEKLKTAERREDAGFRKLDA